MKTPKNRNTIRVISINLIINFGAFLQDCCQYERKYKMIRSLWISKTGMDAQQTEMDVISNNLANVSTNGFKSSRAVFEDLLYQNIRQPGAQSSQQTQLPSGLQLGTGVRNVATERIFTQGNLQH